MDCLKSECEQKVFVFLQFLRCWKSILKSAAALVAVISAGFEQCQAVLLSEPVVSNAQGIVHVLLAIDLYSYF